MSESVDLYFMWAKDKRHRTIVKQRPVKMCQKCKTQVTSHQQANYCTRCRREESWSAQNRKGYVTGHCLDCGVDLEKKPTSRKRRCTPCWRKHTRNRERETAYRLGQTNMVPLYRRGCQYLGCTQRVEGKSVNARYCRNHIKLARREKQAIEREKLARASLTVVEYCAKRLDDIAFRGEITRKEILEIRRLGRMLEACTISPDTVRKQKKRETVAS